MGHAKELITMDVYGDNVNIIPEEIPQLLSYMDEVMPERENNGDIENDIPDTMIDIERFLTERKISGDE